MMLSYRMPLISRGRICCTLMKSRIRLFLASVTCFSSCQKIQWFLRKSRSFLPETQHIKDIEQTDCRVIKIKNKKRSNLIKEPRPVGIAECFYQVVSKRRRRVFQLGTKLPNSNLYPISCNHPKFYNLYPVSTIF